MIIVVNQPDHPSVTSHSSSGSIMMKDGRSYHFDTLECSEEGYLLKYKDVYDYDYDGSKITIVVPYEKVEVIKYG